MNYTERLNKVIPAGAHTYSRASDQFPSNAPQILARGFGAYVWDTFGNKFLDYGMALRAVTLGYSNPRVNAAAINQIDNGNNLTRPSMIELEAAELFTKIIPGADMVKFAKNGSNVTTAAVKIARAYNGRRYVCVPKQHPFFSFDDWFIGTTPLQRGIPEEYVKSTLVFDYNDIHSLEKLFDDHPNDIAAVMLEPATNVVPCATSCTEMEVESFCISCPNKANNFLHQVRSLCSSKGALLILDEMITGFRWSLKGAGHYFGVIPDLVTFGKGMANGFSVAAVAGRRDVMQVGSIDMPGFERTFLLSTTHGGEMSGLGAFVETVKIYQEADVCRHLWWYGAELKSRVNSLAKSMDIQDYFQITGPAISLGYLTKGMNGEHSWAFRTLLAQELIKSGVLMPSWIAVSYSHSNEEIAITLNAFERAFKVYKSALNQGVEKYLQGPEIKPVFRKYN